MKLRVARIDNGFIIQRRHWGSWYNMFFNPKTKDLRTGAEQGDADTVNALFDDLQEALRYARTFKGHRKLIIREIWRV